MNVNVSKVTVTVAGVDYTPLTLRITADNNWTPTWQGSATFAAGKAPNVDPTTYPKARIKWWFGDPSAPQLVLDCLLYIRSSVADDMAGTVALTFLSAEILLMDDANTSLSDYQPGAITAAALYAYAMNRLVTKHGITYDAGQIAPNVLPAAATVWKAGQNADTWVRPNIRGQDREVYQDMLYALGLGDGNRPYLSTWYTRNPGKEAEIGGFANVVYGKNMLESRFGVDIDDPGWADAVTAVYSWTDGTGASRRKSYRSFVGDGTTYKRNVTINYDSADPGYDPTPGLLYGRQMRSSTARIASTPGLAYSETGPNASSNAHRHLLGEKIAAKRRNGSVYYATVSRLEWAWPDNKITYGLADVEVGGALYDLPTP